ncbi:UDP-glycosyltransferase 74F2-like [Primulina tabacum]|uniref:UDP-glycosyltransferase 74F2-like n=1 Tax=Primulina tabacum TaxID=48773 RepID=UPI003F59E314
MNREYRAHILAVPYPSQGHVNPMLQFCKSLASKGAKTTFAITKFISKSTQQKFDLVSVGTISDGYDEGGFMEAESIADYLARMEVVGSRTLEELIVANQKSSHPVDCIVYDAFLPWALEVAKRCGIKGACFFTQACAVNYVFYYAYHGMLQLPVTSTPIEIPGMPLLDLPDMPSFIYKHGTYPAYFEMVLNQFSNSDKADFVLVNTWYKLEEKVVDAMNKVCPLLTLGPTLPSFYLDKRVENDCDYGLNLFQLDSSMDIINWLNTKPIGSVIYVAFGSMVNLEKPQMEEVAYALKSTNFHFLWVIKESDKLEKLPKDFIDETAGKCLLISWSPQLQVLSNNAIGCFFSHGGWNSTTEALSLGVPMVVMPQWTDQTTVAKFVQDVWRVGVRVCVDHDGIVRREEIESCLREVMVGEIGKEFKRNAIKYWDLAKEAVSEGGTTYANIDKFIFESGKRG